MTKIIVIDPGHGGSDSGAVANGLQEKALTLDVSKRTKKYLDNNYTGHTVHLTRTTDKYLSLSERARYANNKKADLFVSMHINAGGGTGYETFIYSNVSNTSSTGKMQNTVHAEANKQMKVTDRGKKKANFAVLRETNMPAILPENLFIDRKEDAAKLKDSKFLDKVAKGHAIGIAKTLGLKKKGSTSTSNKTSNTNTSKSNKKPSTSNKTSSKGDMKTGSIVVYLQSIGEPYSFAHRKKLATKHGIKNYTGTASQNKRLLSILRGSKASDESSNTKPSPKHKTPTTASIKRMADEVIEGKHGSGHDKRRKSLGVNQSTYEKVRAEVNRRSGVKTAPNKSKSISQMATEVLAGKHGQGHAQRQKSLGVDSATYAKVRAEVNKRA